MNGNENHLVDQVPQESPALRANPEPGEQPKRLSHADERPDPDDEGAHLAHGKPDATEDNADSPRQNELLPCPFCADIPLWRQKTDYGPLRWWIACRCGIELTTAWINKAEAAKVWNRRNVGERVTGETSSVTGGNENHEAAQVPQNPASASTVRQEEGETEFDRLKRQKNAILALEKESASAITAVLQKSLSVLSKARSYVQEINNVEGATQPCSPLVERRSDRLLMEMDSLLIELRLLSEHGGEQGAALIPEHSSSSASLREKEEQKDKFRLTAEAQLMAESWKPGLCESHKVMMELSGESGCPICNRVEQAERLAAEKEASEPNTHVLQMARELIDRLDVIHADEHYKAVWFCYANHGGDYSDGPKYTDELAALRQAVELAEQRHLSASGGSYGAGRVSSPTFPSLSSPAPKSEGKTEEKNFEEPEA